MLRASKKIIGKALGVAFEAFKFHEVLSASESHGHIMSRSRIFFSIQRSLSGG